MADPHSILKKVFGYDSFRPGQEDIVRRLLDGQDVNGGEGVKDPACLAMTTESLTREYPLYTPSLLNLVKTSETHVKGLTPEP